jgi:hypothetical protein
MATSILVAMEVHKLVRRPAEAKEYGRTR